jgi:hypothetical protein
VNHQAQTTLPLQQEDHLHPCMRTASSPAPLELSCWRCTCSMPQRPSSAITLPCTSEPINDTMDTCENEKKETMTTTATKREMRGKKA